MKKTISVPITQAGLWLDSDITYAQVPAWFGHVTQDLKLSVIRPFEGEAKPWPLIVWICGGGWVQMDVDAHLPNFVQLARAGFVVASVQYRLSHEGKYPDQLDDLKAALAYLKKNASRYNLDPARIGVMGESAGGWLTTQLALNADVQAACPWYPPYDLAFGEKTGEPGRIAPEALLLGWDAKVSPKALKAAHPGKRMKATSPPFLILHGDNDPVVPWTESQALYDALTAAGASADFYLIKGAGHAAPEFFQPPVLKLIREFFVRTLKGS